MDRAFSRDCIAWQLAKEQLNSSTVNRLRAGRQFEPTLSNKKKSVIKNDWSIAQFKGPGFILQYQKHAQRERKEKSNNLPSFPRLPRTGVE